MPTRAQVHEALDNLTQTVLVGQNVIFGNQENLNYSKGTLPFIRQRVIFLDYEQKELGRPSSTRSHGSIVFTLHVQKGSGDGIRNQLSDLINKNFCNTQIGGAVFYGSKELPLGSAENWSLTGVRIPFFFDEV